MAREDFQFFDGYFDASLEQTVEVVDGFLGVLLEVKPHVLLKVMLLDDGKIWQGYFYEPQEWGKDDLQYGYVQIKRVYENSKKPIHVWVYCSDPKYHVWITNLVVLLHKYLPISDGSPPPTKDPWLLIPDNGYDHKLLELWHKGFTGPKIAEMLSISKDSVYERLRILRKRWGDKIVPYHYSSRRHTQ